MSTGPDTQEWCAFLFRACHDLRTQVRGIRTNVEMLMHARAGAEEAGSEKQLSQIQRGAVRLDNLVDGLARYAVALETDPAEFQRVDLGFVARSVRARVGKDLQAASAELSFRDLPSVTGNADRLMELLEVLVRNALVHRGADAPKIRISAEDRGGEWEITVQDNGPGVAEHFVESIFRPFEKLDGKTKEGTGLGLAIAKAIVERHGGRIWAEPVDGLKVVFTLPKEKI